MMMLSHLMGAWLTVTLLALGAVFLWLAEAVVSLPRRRCESTGMCWLWPAALHNAWVPYAFVKIQRTRCCPPWFRGCKCQRSRLLWHWVPVLHWRHLCSMYACIPARTSH